MPADRDNPSRFAEGFLHEARNAVFGLSVTLDALEEDGDPGGALVEQVRTLASLSDRTARLMHDLVTYVEAPPSEKAPARLGEIVHAAVAEARERLGARPLVLVGEEHLDLTAPFEADAPQLGRAIASVIQGAAIAVPAPGPVQLVLARPHPRRVELTITASGAEVSAERVITFFDPFAIRAARITGFAVALARRCFEAHGIGVRLVRNADDGLILTLAFNQA